MRLTLLSFVALGLAGLFAEQAAGQDRAQNPDEPRYGVAGVTVDLAKGQKIGRRRAGYVCLPHGSVVWGRDVAPASDRLVEAVARGLGNGGLPIPSADAQMLGGPAETAYLVGAVVRKAEFSTCLPHYGPGFGIGDRSSVKGWASLEVEWKVYSKQARSIVRTHVTQARAIAKADERVDTEDLFLRALERSAERFAPLAAEPDGQRSE